MGDRRTRTLLAVLGTTTIAALVAAALVSAAPTADGDRLPDLGMAPIADIKVGNSQGRQLLRFTATIVNVGDGPFELDLHRDSVTDPSMAVTQTIYTTTGTRTVSTSAQTVFGGDGHNHWHIANLENSTLTRLDNGSKVGTGVKLGFCFVDNVKYRLTLPGAPRNAQYGGCSTQGALDVEMGLSVGWGDEYRWSLPDQYVDITDLTPGRYRLTVTADNLDWFVESNDGNNATWVDLQIKGKGRVRIDGYGPSA